MGKKPTETQPDGAALQGKPAKWNCPFIISVFALIVAIIGAVASWRGTIAALDRNTAEQQKLAADQEAKAQLQWQTAIVYGIIEDGSKSNVNGPSFNEIRDKYVIAATAEQEIKIDKKKLSPLELKLVLLSLLESKLIYQSPLDTYIAGRTQFILGGEVSFNVNRAMGAILAMLSTTGGEYTVAKLEQQILNQVKVSKEEYYLAINQLIAFNAVSLDNTTKLWATANPKK